MPTVGDIEIVRALAVPAKYLRNELCPADNDLSLPVLRATSPLLTQRVWQPDPQSDVEDREQSPQVLAGHLPHRRRNGGSGHGHSGGKRDRRSPATPEIRRAL